eukprot:3802611-Alexandrium_andersonii.AAC.1
MQRAEQSSALSGAAGTLSACQARTRHPEYRGSILDIGLNRTLVSVVRTVSVHWKVQTGRRTRACAAGPPYVQFRSTAHAAGVCCTCCPGGGHVDRRNNPIENAGEAITSGGRCAAVAVASTWT